MSLEERCYNILTVSATNSLTSAIGALFPEFRCTPIHNATTINVAKRIITERFYDFATINSPLSDDVGTRLAVGTCTLKHTVVLLLVETDIHTTIHDKVAERSAPTLPKPTSKAILIQALYWMESMREHLKQFEKRSVSTEEKMAEIHIVNKTKWLLIGELRMSESDTYCYIEKQAMDQCMTKGGIAENIIKTYS